MQLLFSLYCRAVLLSLPSCDPLIQFLIVWWPSTITLFLLLLHNYNFASVINCNVNICFLIVLDDPCKRVFRHHPHHRSLSLQVENQFSRVLIMSECSTNPKVKPHITTSSWWHLSILRICPVCPRKPQRCLWTKCPTHLGTAHLGTGSFLAMGLFCVFKQCPWPCLSDACVNPSMTTKKCHQMLPNVHWGQGRSWIRTSTPGKALGLRKHSNYSTGLTWGTNPSASIRVEESIPLAQHLAKEMQDGRWELPSKPETISWIVVSLRTKLNVTVVHGMSP